MPITADDIAAAQTRLGLSAPSPAAAPPTPGSEPAGAQPEPRDLSAKEVHALNVTEDNKGLKGDLKVAGAKFANEALFDIPEWAWKNFIASEQDKEDWDTLQEAHKGAAALGSTVGAVANIVATGGVFGGAAKAVRGAVEGAELLGGASKLARAGRFIAGEAAENAVIDAPRALVDAATQDPKTAAENYALNIGLGSAISAVGHGLKPLAKVGDQLVESGAKRVNEFAKENDTALKKLFSGKDADEKVRQSLVKKAGGKEAVEDFLQKNPSILAADDKFAAARQVADEAVARAKAQNGPLFDADPHALVRSADYAKQADDVASMMEHVRDLADSKGLGDQLKSAAFQSALIYGAYQIDPTVGQLVGSGVVGQKLTDKSFLKSIARQAGEHALQTDFGKRLLNGAATYLRDSTDDVITKSLSKLTTAAKYSVPEGHKLLADLGHTPDEVESSLVRNNLVKSDDEWIAAAKAHQVLAPEAVDALKQMGKQARSYLADAYPRPPELPGPFDSRSPWKPSREELKAFSDKLEVVNDPTKLVDRIRDGTLNSNHLEAAERVWPAFVSQLRTKALELISDSKNQKARDFLKKRQDEFNLLMGSGQRPQTTAAQAPTTATSAQPGSQQQSYGKGAISQKGLSAIEPLTTNNRIEGNAAGPA